MRCLVVIPAFNEEEALPKTLASLQHLPEYFEILVVNDGSRDGTQLAAEVAAAASRLKVHVVRLPANCGIGVAVQTGYLFALKEEAYKYVIQFDADGQHDVAALSRMVEECETKQLDVCIGSRFIDGEGFQSNFQRRLGIRFFAWLIWLLTGARVTDPTSGLRCVGPRVWSRFARYYPEDYPEPESLFWCARNRMNIGEIPVIMRERQGGVSSLTHHWRPVYYMIKVSVAILLDRLRQRECRD
ncbi:MAG TPA: glycosyltransferase family 2 protein [Gemmataceae bacterium]|nr:glycosyltransferase family 2 protein [Gemmataceae bacterium]